MNTDGPLSAKGVIAKRVYDLEDRLLNFAAAVIDVSEKLPNTRAANHIAGQILRSGTSPYGNHSEAQAPESAEDFIHKMKIAAKEAEETKGWLMLCKYSKSYPEPDQLLQNLTSILKLLNKIISTAKQPSAN